MVQQLSLMQDLDKPWGVGLVMFTVAKRFELLHLALEFGPQVVALSFGDARPFIEPIHQANAKVIVQVHDVDQALYALDAGADALIVQGAEAGAQLAQILHAFVPGSSRCRGRERNPDRNRWDS